MTGDIMYLAICLHCTPVLPQPFYDQHKRDEWTEAHEDATGHGVVHGAVGPGGKVVER